jgi:C1A family cysteine protease
MMMKKFKKIALILSVLTLAVVLAGCALAPKTSKPVASQTLPALGLRPMPKAFLNWWFEKVPNFNSNAIAKGKKPIGLIGVKNDILSTQSKLTSPVLSNLPNDFDLRNYGDVTPVKDQGANGTCWAFSTVGSLESAMLVQLGSSGIQSRYPFISDPNSPNLSEQFVAYNNANWQISWGGDEPRSISYQETNEDNGGNQFFSFYDLVRRGVPLESDFPYITSSQPWIKWDAQDGTWPQHLVKPSYTIAIQPANQFSNYTTYINIIKSALIKYGALSVSICVYSDFQNNRKKPDGWVYKPSPSAKPLEKCGHAVLLVGWDDNYTYNGVDYGPVWILKNSWGTSWGDQGYWRQPMVTSNEFNSRSIPSWKISNHPMWVPHFNK